MRASRFAAICILMAAMAMSVVWAEQTEQDFPDIFWKQFMSGEKAPLWVSADMATNTKGSFDWEVVGDFNKRQFEAILANHTKNTSKKVAGNSETCLNLAESYWPSPRKLSVQEIENRLIRNANAIFAGKVVAVKGGIYSGQPGSLMKLDVSRIIKNPLYFDIPKFAYVYHINGRFRFGDYEICNQLPKFSHLPEVGDTVVVFSVTGPLDPEAKFYAPSETIFITSSGTVLMTPRMATISGLLEVKNAYDVEQYVHRLRVGLESVDDSDVDRRQP